jgi:hypothetical protein
MKKFFTFDVLNQILSLVIFISAFININSEADIKITERTERRFTHSNILAEVQSAITSDDTPIPVHSNNTTEMSMFSFVSSPSPSTSTENNLMESRYNSIEYYGKNDFIESKVNEWYPNIILFSEEAKVNPAVIMAIIIIECIKPDNSLPEKGRLTDMALNANNFSSIKTKNGSYYSDYFISFLDRCSDDSAYMQKDDDYINGELVESQFYHFSSVWCGLKATVNFIADRVNSEHPNYVGKFDNLSLDDYEGWAYALYDAGYANKNSDVPYDVKLVRNIRQYSLDKIDLWK